MSVRRGEQGTIVLEGVCPVEDAEPLTQLILATPEAKCDWRHCSQLHTGVIQVILRARPALIGPCGDPWVEEWVATQAWN